MSHKHDQFDIACRHVADGHRPVLYAWRYPDGQFGMNCGYGDHPEGQSYVALCRQCSVEKMPEYSFFYTLDPGQDMSRETASDNNWIVGTLPDEEESQ